MKILLDNCAPVKFARLLLGHEVTHCSRVGWEKLSNGRLLAAAEDAGFMVMVTVDKSIPFQQNMTRRKIAVIYMRAVQNDLKTLRPMAPLVLAALENLQLGTVLTLTHPDWR